MTFESDQTINGVEDAPVFSLDIEGFRFDEEKIGKRPHSLTDEVVEYVAGLLARRYRKHQVKQEIASLLGKSADELGKTFIELTLRYARLWLRVNIEERTIVDQKASGVAFLESVIQNPKTSMQNKLRAQKELNWMLGIGPQFSQAVYDPSQIRELVKRSVVAMDNDCEPPPEES